MKTKIIICISFLYILSGCTPSKVVEIEEVEADDVTTETDENEIEESVVVEESEEELLVEPSEIMKDWALNTPEEKIQLINECLEYEQLKQQAENSPITIIGTPEQFVEVIDARYEEIEGFDGFEKYRMHNSTVSAQVGIMGHANQLIDFQ